MVQIQKFATAVDDGLIAAAAATVQGPLVRHRGAGGDHQPGRPLERV